MFFGCERLFSSSCDRVARHTCKLHGACARRRPPTIGSCKHPSPGSATQPGTGIDVPPTSGTAATPMGMARLSSSPTGDAALSALGLELMRGPCQPHEATPAAARISAQSCPTSGRWAGSRTSMRARCSPVRTPRGCCSSAKLVLLEDGAARERVGDGRARRHEPRRHPVAPEIAGAAWA